MTNTIHNNVQIRIIDQNNHHDLSTLFKFMQDETGMRIRNQKNPYSSQEFEAYYLSAIRHHHFFLIIQLDDQEIGYFHISCNQQHRIAHIDFTLLWNHKDLPHIFASAFLLLSSWLKDSHQIERLAIPITGEHKDIQTLLLSSPQITQSLTLAQEHLDKNNQRQPVTFYDCFLN